MKAVLARPLAAIALLLATPAFADALIDNVNGYTIGKGGEVERFTGLLIDGEGKVVRTLGHKDKRPEKLDFRMDGQGRTLVPGLIDAHGHVMGLGFNALQLDLSETRSLAEAQDKLRQWVRDNPGQRWVIGRGWNQERWGLGRFPTAADIDAAVADKPVWLIRIDGHAGVANSAALALAGIDGKTQAPAGGRIEMASGRPTGLFVDAATALMERAVPPPQPLERDLAFARAQQILIEDGITAVADMGTTADDWAVMRRAGDLGRLRVRIISYAHGIEPLIAIAGTGPTPWLYGGRLRMVGVKLYEDGALGSRGAWLKADYADAPGQRGLMLLNDAKLKNLGSRAAMDNFQVAIHAIGDAANAQALDAIEELSDTYKGDRRWRIEHAQIVDPADLPRFGRHGIIASMQPVHQTSDRLMAEARLGPARLAGAYAWASMRKAGATLAFGSDFPVESPDPFAGLAAATSREDPAGQPPGGWMPEQKLSPAEALAAFTRDAAYAGFAEDRIGSLEPGRYADFLLLDRDILAATPADIRATRVLETWIGGKRIWVRK
ncbi:amidohydrolase [Edaphosphingomonas haloaromaticamans]|uniref:N-substituted formamide deformylase n=1 Tax=Edaphosphingomonas haloaromaticamans TaxID=653954 RepID=A0A1S1HB18_9SPHN|nr:amidohydrolase [Sphingomonas haloaromaticamans]OHT19354.1 N-substituted formamide deformylase precursor [Sphingomonas haloaromaticamans]